MTEFLEKGDDLLARVLKMPPASALDEALRKQAEEGEEKVPEVVAPAGVPDEAGPGTQGSRPHAFVVMPFGRKPAADGRWIDFDAAACGGDILFIEACRARGMAVDVYLPCADAHYIEERVAYAGDHWVERFYELRSQGEVRIHHQQERLGLAPEGEDAFERNNRWALYSSLMHGVDRTRLVALWDGKSTSAGGKRDGTADMVERMRHLGGMVEHLNTTTFRQWSGKMRKALDVLTGQFKMPS